MTYEQYRRKVMAEIVRLLNGKPKFRLDRWVIEDSYNKSHDPIVPAKWLIDEAIAAEKAKKK